jgi:hypothetical protein
MECKPSGHADTFPKQANYMHVKPVHNIDNTSLQLGVWQISWLLLLPEGSHLICRIMGSRKVKSDRLMCNDQLYFTSIMFLSHRAQTLMQLSQRPCKLLFSWMGSQTVRKLVTKLIRVAMFISSDDVVSIFWINTCFKKCGREWWYNTGVDSSWVRWNTTLLNSDEENDTNFRYTYS